MNFAIKRLSCVLICTLFISWCRADHVEPWNPLADANVPALMFVNESSEPNAYGRTSLYTTSFPGDTIQTQKILTSQYLQVDQISNSAVFIRTHTVLDDLWHIAFYLADVRQGKQVLLSESQEPNDPIHFYCLRAVPEDNRALLFRYGPGVESNQILDVNLTTLAVDEHYNFPKDGEYDLFSWSPTYLQVSPDGRHLTTMALDLERFVWGEEYTYYRLKHLDLETLTLTDLDPNVSVMVGRWSSHAYGIPPHDWISPTEILYQHMPVPDPIDPYAEEGTYVLKSVNIETGDISTWTTHQMPMTMDGGSLNLDPFTGIIHYHDFIVDPNSKTVQDPQLPYEVIRDYKQKTSTICFNDEVLYTGEIYYGTVNVLLSPSERYFAYQAQGGLYVYYPEKNESVKAEDFNNVSFSLIGWIEPTPIADPNE